MNIRLDKEVRIRLNEEDITSWKNTRRLIQSFSFGSFVFQVSICFDTAASASYVHSEGQKLVVGLTLKDSDILFSSSSNKDIIVDGISLQVDRWNKDKRVRHEEKRSKDKSI
jgi:hypothetical protein